MPVDPLSLFTIPLTLALAALFIAVAAYDFITFRRRRKNGKQAVYRCDACRHIYTAPHRTPLARCPKCGKQNEPVRE
jgi:rRNA maturation endonuclease Nob1